MNIFDLNAPALATCNRCGRSTWSPYEVNAEDRMPQPDGNPCGGRLVPQSGNSSPRQWRDRHGDVWTEGADGLMHTRETRPFPREHVEKKWGPLVPQSEGSQS